MRRFGLPDGKGGREGGFGGTEGGRDGGTDGKTDQTNATLTHVTSSIGGGDEGVFLIGRLVANFHPAVALLRSQKLILSKVGLNR